MTFFAFELNKIFGLKIEGGTLLNVLLKGMVLSGYALYRIPLAKLTKPYELLNVGPHSGELKSSERILRENSVKFQKLLIPRPITLPNVTP